MHLLPIGSHVFERRYAFGLHRFEAIPAFRLLDLM